MTRRALPAGATWARGIAHSAPTDHGNPIIADDVDRLLSRGMYGPAARRKMISELGEREKLHQCIRPQEWS